MDDLNLDKKKIYIKLFLSTLYISTVAFGGGLVIIELLRKRFVEEYGWVKNEEMADIIVIAQSTPGAIGSNAALIIGYRLLGIKGAAAALIATVIPPIIIISLLTMFYSFIRDNAVASYILKGMQAGAAAVILNLVYKMGKDVVEGKGLIVIVMLVTAFVAAFIFKVSVPLVMLISASIGIITTYYNIYKERSAK
jgi:chromate transporter